MIFDIKFQLEGLIRNNSFLYESIDDLDLDVKLKQLLLHVITKVSTPFFALDFLHHSVKKNRPSFILDNEDLTVCNVSYSVMISLSTNMIIGDVEGIIFVIAQHVTSCDFIYFPEYDYYHPVVHSDMSSAIKQLKVMLKYFETTTLGDLPKIAHLEGLIVSHGRPYHFFYDTAIMVQKLYEQNLLNVFDHYQIQDHNFLDFTELYNLPVNNHVTNAKELNSSSKNANKVYFKVGLAFKKNNESIVALAERMDKQLLNNVDSMIEGDEIFNKIKLLKSSCHFILWLGIATEKRSLSNQVELAVEIINKLSKSHRVCVVIDGWTFADRREKNNLDVLLPDLAVFNTIKNSCPQAEFVSLIGADSTQKIAVANLVDFHISSAATGSMWTSRFAKKKGVLHTSHAFYPVTKGAQLHYNSLYIPGEMIEDLLVEGDREDYVSYQIDVEKALRFISDQFPIIYTEDYDLSLLQVERLSHMVCNNSVQNLYTTVTNDPQFHLQLDDFNLKGSFFPYLLTLVSYLNYKEDVTGKEAKIYLDYGKGFIETNTVTFPLQGRSTRVELFIEVNMPIKRLRFDPINTLVEFNYHNLFYKIYTLEE